ncbi:PREDICTED: ABSCISIC ACID-INSENSITIVE 5-like protein 2 isoform X2 [Tarenaya hassleriana]|uniref:ABSCISIC ACID-INSENSITIVE 5-like protein 2 isoform X2 n=1 Tax=Tarenaya hassleriana TaxID=28532 RepID=UPI00053C52D7|nr:PREDICTED: ABSCISIC ACID-INSENSITIVE 5-like protein 2 isoform X2 [Tarenaya hassleriana]
MNILSVTEERKSQRSSIFLHCANAEVYSLSLSHKPRNLSFFLLRLLPQSISSFSVVFLSICISFEVCCLSGLLGFFCVRFHFVFGCSMEGEDCGSAKNSEFEPLARENSMCNLTPEEIDEILKNVWTAEPNQTVVTGPGGVILGSESSSMQSQASLPLTTGTFGEKTVYEVWREMEISEGSEENKRQERRQPCLEEITLEDFLAKAGVVSESTIEKQSCGSASGFDPNINPQLLHYQRQGMITAQPLLAGSSAMTGAALPNPWTGTLSDAQMSVWERRLLGQSSKESVERRQRRMIKNRESAARSRAKKQAYTNSLENRVSILKEVNQRLKKQKELEEMLPETPLDEPKYQLRRTSSAPF